MVEKYELCKMHPSDCHVSGTSTLKCDELKNLLGPMGFIRYQCILQGVICRKRGNSGFNLKILRRRLAGGEDSRQNIMEWLSWAQC